MMLTFIQKCGATSETAEDLRDFIMNAKNPSNLHFEDIKQPLEELNDYLPYLPGPLNQRLGDDQLFVTLKKCVPAWQKKYIDSNTRKNIENVNDLADYYSDLENQEKKECNQDNQHRDRNSSQGQNRSQQRIRSQRSNKNHYIERNNGNSNRRQGGSDSRNSRGRSSNDNRHG
jgi:5'-3' exonuclease